MKEDLTVEGTGGTLKNPNTEMKGNASVGTDLHVHGGMLSTPFGGLGRYENLLKQSQDLTQTTAWTRTGLDATTPVALNATAPDGTANGAATIKNGAAANGTLAQTVTASASTAYTFSVWLQAGTSTTVDLILAGDGNAVATTSSVTPPATAWQRYSVTHTTGSTSANITATIKNTGAAATTILAWGAQLEQASTVGAYAKTTTNAISSARGLVVSGKAALLGDVDLGDLTTHTIKVKGTVKGNSPSLVVDQDTAADVADFRRSGVSQFKIDQNGAITARGPLSVDSPTFYVDSTNHRVGVGTTSPGVVLDISSAAGGNVLRMLGSGTNSQYLTFNTTGGTYYIGAESSVGNINTGGTAYALAITPAVNRKLQFGYSGGTGVAMTVDTTGSVGLGTTGPASKLDARGQVASQSWLQVWNTGNVGTLAGGDARSAVILGANDTAQGWFIGPTGDSTAANMDLGFWKWNPSGTWKVVFDKNGNVGIGTTSPGAPLQVYRSTLATAGTLAETVTQATLALNRLRGDVDSGLFFGIGGATLPYVQGNNNAGTSAQSILLNPYGGNVGIGTTAPAQKLDVNGNIRLAGNAGNFIAWGDANGGQPKLVNSANGQLEIYANQDDTSADIVIPPNNFMTLRNGVFDGVGAVGFRFDSRRVLTTGADLVWFTNAGVRKASIDANGGAYFGSNVGIGSTTPGSVLTVLGSQPAAVGTTPGTAATSVLGITGGTGGNTTIATTGTGGVGAALSLTGGTGGAATAAATAATGGKGGSLTVTAGTGGAATVVGTGTNVGGAGGDVTINPGTGGAASGGSVNTAGAVGNLLLATAGGNVGIGTTGPAFSLHMFANAGNTGLRLENVATGPTNWIDLVKARAGQAAVQSGDITGGITFKGYDGSGYLNTAYIQSVVDGTAGASNMPGRLMFFTTPSGSGLASERLRIDNAGNVGIGTTSPGAKLEVAGQVKITGGAPGANKVLTSDASGLATWTALSGVSGVSGTGTLNYLSKWTPDGTTVGNSQIFDNGTNVGIGTTGPVVKLDVNGTIQGSTGLTLTGNAAQVTTTYAGLTVSRFFTDSGGGVISVDGANKFSLRNGGASGTDTLTVLGIGNVGIGTTVPQSRLEVNKAGGTTFSSSDQLRINSGTSGNRAELHLTDGFTSDAFISFKPSATATSRYLSIGAGSNGDNELVVRGDGNVGIGTTGPTSKLDISNGWIEVDNQYGINGQNSYLQFNPVSNYAARIYRDGTGADGLLEVTSTGLTSSSASQFGLTINPTISQSGTAGYTALLVNPTESTTGSGNKFLANFQVGGSSKVAITNAGNVGIGTTSPISVLEVVRPTTATTPITFSIASDFSPPGTGVTGLSLNDYRAAHTASHLALRYILKNSAGSAVDYGEILGHSTGITAGAENGALTFRTVNAGAFGERVRIDSAGNVGIGTTAPSAKLDVVGDAWLSGIVSSPYGGLGTYANLLTYSEDLTQSAWGRSGLDATTPVALNVTAPDGVANGAVTMKNGAAANGTLAQTVTASASTAYVFSAWLKAGTSTTAQVELTGNGTGETASTQAVTLTGSWQRLSVSHTSLASTTTATATLKNTGAAATTILAWGAQLEAASSPSVYVQTTTAAVAAARGLVTNDSLRMVNLTLAEGGTLTFGGDATLSRAAASTLQTAKLTLTDTLTFSGVTTDITTGPNEHLALMPNGTGNVGIGTTSPAQKLTVVGDASVSTQLYASDIRSYSGNININSNSASNALVFQIASSEKMRVNTDGNVGIGMAGPGAALDVIKPGNANVYENGIRANRPDAQGQYAFMGYGQSGSEAYFGSVYTGGVGVYGSIHLRQYTQGMTARDALNIDSSGNVGIGTTAPGSPLEVYTSAASGSGVTTLLRLNGSPNAASDGNAIEFLSGSGGQKVFKIHTLLTSNNYGDTVFSGGNNAAQGAGSWVERMRLKDNGNLGIGTTSPGALLHVSGGALYINDANGSSVNRLNLSYAGTSGIATIGPNSTGGSTYLALGTSNGGAYSEKVRIDNAGNVGIGTTSPGAKLDVRGAIKFGDTAGYFIAAPTYGFRFNNDTDANNLFRIWNTGGAAFGTTYAAGSDPGANNVVIQGNVGIGTTSPFTKLHVNLTTGQLALFGGSNLGTTATNYSGIALGYGESGPLYVKSAIVQEQTGDAHARGKIHILNSNASGNANATLSDARVTILQTGEVGLGTTAPSAKLDVVGDAWLSGIVSSPYGGLGTYANLLTYSEDLTQSAWVRSGLDATTPVALNVTAPDGVATGAVTMKNGAAANGTLAQTVTVSASTAYVFSAWLKAGTSTTAQVELTGNGTGETASTQAVTLTGSWQRLSVSHTSLASTTTATATLKNTGAAATTILAWGAQLEAASSPSVYVQTTTAAVAAARGLVTNDSLRMVNLTLAEGGTLTFGGDATLSRAAASTLQTGALTLTGTLTFSNVVTDITTGTNEHLALMPNGTGNVGIGTTVPGAKLELYGSRFRINDGSGNYGELFTGSSGGLTATHLGTISNLPLAFYTNSSAPLMTIATSGNVGIGTTSPGAKLEVAGSFVSGQGVRVNYGNASGQVDYIDLYGNGGSGGQIGLQLVDATNADLWFGSSGGRAMTIYRNQNVGIGTASPLAGLDLRGANKAYSSDDEGNISIVSTDSMAVDKGGMISFKGSYTGTSAASFAKISGRKENATDSNLAGYLQLATRSVSSGLVEAIRIDSSQRVGIGTTSPVSLLHVAGGNLTMSNNQAIVFRTTGGANASSLSLTSSDNLNLGQSNVNILGTNIFGGTGNVTINAGAVEVARFTTSGNVGIGTTNPLSQFDIAATTATMSLSSGAAIDLYFEGSSVNNKIDSRRSNDLLFQINSATKMVLQGSTGNVGIGSTTPGSVLTVLGSQPAAVGTTPGTAATSALGITGGTGGNTTIATTGTGGVGAALSLTGGTGGQATAAATAATGGKGGSLTVTAGTGGAATVVGTGTNVGGAGGDVTINPGAGGAASGGSVNTAGAVGNLLLATAGGNVGIGTTVPAAKLQVRDTTGGGTAAAIYQNATSGANFGIIAQGNGAATTMVGGQFDALGATNNRAIQITTDTAAGANNYAIYSVSPAQSYFAGNVGIANVSPAEKLDVTGNIHATGNFAVGAPIVSNIAGLVRGTQTGDLSAGVKTSVSLTTSGNNQNLYGYLASDNLALGANTGAVYSGVTVTNPGIISGAPGFLRGLQIQALTTGSTENSAIYIVSPTGTSANYGINIASAPSGGTANYAIYSVGGTNYFGGNVGIGTTSPGAALEVNGGARLNTSTAKPTCDATKRGTFWVTQGGTGVKDAVEVCAKDAADAYAWRTIY